MNSMSVGNEFLAHAKEHGVDGIDPRNKPTLRRLHGRLMTRLAETSARTVAFDIALPAPSDADDAFIAGVQTLREHGIPVVIAVPAWTLSAAGEQQRSAKI